MPRSNLFEDGLVLFGCFLVAGLSAWACDIPVYRWALDNWEADPYSVIVFHDGPLTPQQQAVVDGLKPGPGDSSGTPKDSGLPNLRVQTADVTALSDDLLRAVWEAQASPDLPWMVARYPYSPPRRKDVWAGPLNEANVEALLDSPKRQDVAKPLLAGDPAVWVLLEFGDGQKDQAALDTLQKTLATIKETPLQALNVPYAQRDLSQGQPEKLTHHIVRLSRKDPAERLFVAMLLGSEHDLKDFAEPMAFPVFGRGRALYALVGAGITLDNIKEAALFLITACSCLVKEQNPGIDLLMAVDWGQRTEEQPLPQLVPSAPPPLPEEAIPETTPQGFLRNVVIALAAAFLVVVAATIVLARRRLG